MTFHGYAEPERVLVGAHELRDTAADGPFLRFGNERVTRAWLNLPKDRTFDFCEPAFVAGSDTETSWRLCDLHPDSHYDHEWAGGRGFTTGPHPTGYTITGLGVDIDAESGTLDPEASHLHRRDVPTPAGARATPGRTWPSTRRSRHQQVARPLRSGDWQRRAPSRPRTHLCGLLPNNANLGYFQTPNAGRRPGPGRRGRLDPRPSLRQPLRPSAGFRRRRLEPRRRGRQADPAQHLRLAQPAAGRAEPRSPRTRPGPGRQPGQGDECKRLKYRPGFPS